MCDINSGGKYFKNFNSPPPKGSYVFYVYINDTKINHAGFYIEHDTDNVKFRTIEKECISLPRDMLEESVDLYWIHPSNCQTTNKQLSELVRWVVNNQRVLTCRGGGKSRRVKKNLRKRQKKYTRKQRKSRR